MQWSLCFLSANILINFLDRHVHASHDGLKARGRRSPPVRGIFRRGQNICEQKLYIIHAPPRATTTTAGRPRPVATVLARLDRIDW